MKAKLFSVIIDTYFRPQLLKVAVDAVLRQTYENVELVLVNNGATPETIEYLADVEAADRRIKLVHFKENQYKPNQPGLIVEACYNAGLRAATGDYVFHMADDDLIADDYVEKMVALFTANAACSTAAGLPSSIDIDGNLLPEPRTANFRPRYTDGHIVALDALRGGTMYRAPGEIFAIKREVLIAAGGYHPALELSQVYGIVPFGVTGFDETALFYWRRHPGQLSKQLEADGFAAIDEVISVIRDWDLEGRWRVFGPEVAREVVCKLQGQAEAAAADWAGYNIRLLKPRAAYRIVRSCCRYPGFWRRLPLAVWNPLKDPVMPIRMLVKASLRTLFAAVPRTLRLPPRLQALRARIIR